MKELKQQIKFNYENEFNCIPVGFERFEQFFPGIIKGLHVCVTGSQGSGKTKFTNFYFIINVLDFVKKVNDTNRLDVKIFVYNLKTSNDAFRANILSAFLKRDYNIDMSYIQLMSIVKKENRLMNKDIFTIIDSYDNWWEYFDSKVELYDDKKKPSEIFETTEHWIRNEAGKLIPISDNKSVFQYDNPNLFVMNITDEVNSLESEQDRTLGVGMDLRRCIEKHAISNMTTLKNKYKVFCLSTHAQALDRERIEYDFTNRLKEEKLEPSKDGLGDSKTVSRAYDVILGLFAPNNYEIKGHKDYNVGLLQDNYRHLKVISSNISGNNKGISLWFDGSAGTFNELPKAAEKVNGVKKIVFDQLATERYIKSKKK